jgi:hypothetical protein
MRHRYIVPRLSNDEFTFAVVTADVDHDLSAASLRNKLTEALTEWVALTAEGTRAWRASALDFNVGDLAEHLPASRGLRRTLAKHGIRRLTVETFVDCDSPADPWTYDTVLVDAGDTAAPGKGDRAKAQQEVKCP